MIVRLGRRHHSFVTGVGRLSLDQASAAVVADGGRFASVVDAHFDFVWRLLRRLGLPPHDADDAAQQVFVIAMQKLEAVETDKERSFLYGTALRIAANLRRGRKRRHEDAHTALEARASAEPSPEQRAELSQACDFLDELLDTLSDELRRVFVLAEIEQCPVTEIAALEDVPVGTAASRLRRARAEFQHSLARSAHRNPFRGSGL